VSPNAERSARRVEAIWPRLEELCTSGFTDDERTQARALLSKIEQGLAQAAEDEA
jgi:DNA-binding MarR family transcriptional regulator